MKLITETSEILRTRQVLNESNNKKDLYIEGIFLQAEVKNRNGRIYPYPTMSREVGRYISENVSKNKALGELNHPQHPQVNPERACHLVTELKNRGNDWYGKSKVLSTPLGNLVRGLVDDGVQLGVSSRGLGSLKESTSAKIVQDDFRLLCIDVVSDPSAPSAFVNGLYEGAEWIYDNDKLIQIEAEKLKESIDRSFNDSIAIKAFQSFIQTLKR